jgi:hypothetical protein
MRGLPQPQIKIEIRLIDLPRGFAEADQINRHYMKALCQAV